MDEGLIAKRITLYYTILAALFMGMTPQFMGFILPLMFLMPVYMGLHGIKNRKKSGFLIGMGIVPIALAVSVIWIKYSIDVSYDMASEITRMVTQYRMAKEAAQFLFNFTFLLSIVMMGLSVFVAFQLLKHRKIFK